jgi:hypothetical protein
VTTGANDTHAGAWQSRKFAAALQAAGNGVPDASRRTVLLLTRLDAGHGDGAPFSQRVNDSVLSLTFLRGSWGCRRKRFDLLFVSVFGVEQKVSGEVAATKERIHSFNRHSQAAFAEDREFGPPYMWKNAVIISDTAFAFSCGARVTGGAGPVHSRQQCLTGEKSHATYDGGCGSFVDLCVGNARSDIGPRSHHIAAGRSARKSGAAVRTGECAGRCADARARD